MKRILVHCCDPVLLFLIHNELYQKHGFDCEKARGVNEAIDRLLAVENLPTQFELVITDHDEETPGYIDIIQLMKSRPSYKNIPFVFISIDKERFAEVAQKALQHGSEQAFLLPDARDRLYEYVSTRLTK